MTAPVLQQTNPLDEATGVAVTANLVLTFDQTIRLGSSGSIRIYEADGTLVHTIAITDTSQVSLQIGRTPVKVTINPSIDLDPGTSYYVLIDAGAIENTSGQDFAGISSPAALNFTTAGVGGGDTTAPTLTSTAPLDDATNVIPTADIVLTFSEAVQAGSGNIEIHNASDGSVAKSISITDATQVTFAGSQVTINPSTNLAQQTGYYVTLGSGVVLDLANNAFAGISSPNGFNFTTRETTPPTLVSTTPPSGGLNVDVDANLVLTFSEAVKAGQGNITLRYYDGSIAQTIAVTDTSQISFSGNQLTINPNIDLLENTHYYVTLSPGAVRDLANNSYVVTAYAFDFYTTDTNAPTLVDTTPDDDATLVSAGADFILWFNEQVAAGSGNFEIHNVSDGSLARAISVTDASQVSFDGGVVTIDPSSDLDFGGSYYITFGSGVVVDSVGNPFAGISSPTEFNFMVEPSDMTEPYLTAASPDFGATNVPIDSDFVATFSEAVTAGTGSIYITTYGSTVQTINVTDTSQITFLGDQLIIDPTVDLTEGILYSVTWDTSAIRDLAGNYFNGGYPSGLSFRTADPTPPQLTGSMPLDGDTDVWVGTDLHLIFNEDIMAGSGNIEIRDALNGNVVQAIGITSNQVYINGHEVWINPPADLEPAKTYYVTLASGVVLDLAGNPFAGIASPSTFHFSTPPNILYGTPNRETITGGPDNDRINPLAGLDKMVGGTGDDTYIIQNYERDDTLLLFSRAPNPEFYDPDGYVLSFTGDSDVSMDLLDENSDGLIDQLYVYFVDTDFTASITFTSTQLGTALVPGTYLNAEQPWPGTPGHPGFYYTIDSYAPGALTGSFKIASIKFDYSGPTPVLVRASVTFDVDPQGPGHFSGIFNYNYPPGGPLAYDTIVEMPDEGNDTVEAWISYVLGPNIENLTLAGSRQIDGWGNELANIIVGNNLDNLLDGVGGNDTLEGGYGNDTFNVALGGGSDTIRDFGAGEDLRDVVNLDGFALNSFSAVQAAMSQSGANTVLDLGNGQTLTFLNVVPVDFSADDFSFAHLPPPPPPPSPPPPGPEPFTLPVSGAYTTTLTGTRRADNLMGTAANNKIDGRQGNDTMTGLGGDDTYVVDASGDKVIESSGQGIDTVISSASSYTLANNVENLTLTGTSNHVGTGNSLDNLIIASARPDTINGGDGNDIIRAGTGACVLTGGTGNDIFDFDVMGSQKQIADFTAGEDLVDLRTPLSWYGGSDPIADNAITLSAVAGGVLVSVKASAGGALQGLVKITGVSLGDLDLGSDILWDS